MTAKQLSPKKLAANRNGKHMRSALGFYPSNTEGDELYETINDSCLHFLKTNKVSGRNARSKFKEMAVFCQDYSTILTNQRGVDYETTLSLVYASLYSAVGSFESYLSRKRTEKKVTK